MKLDKEDSLLFMRIIMLKHKRTGVFNEDEFLEDIYQIFLAPMDRFLDLLETKLSFTVSEMSPVQDKIFIDELEKDYLFFTNKMKL